LRCRWPAVPGDCGDSRREICGTVKTRPVIHCSALQVREKAENLIMAFKPAAGPIFHRRSGLHIWLSGFAIASRPVNLVLFTSKMVCGIWL
jgi:hypothetical protein